jgi:metal-responsive CopG/Arc/MetJ family transcriptional regulator
MPKRIIQVPIDDELLRNLDNYSGRQSKSRSEVIREACMRYLNDIERHELDRVYQKGYEKMPEQAEIGAAQVKAISKVLPGEVWPDAPG